MTATYSPLRYPGGKSKLAGFVKMLLLTNDLCDGEYAEPYCGGAGIALHLLQSEFVSRVFLNDIDPAIHAFWWTVFNSPEELCRKISSVKLSVQSWKRQKNIFTHKQEHSREELGFATFFLNRANRSGILSAGPIGGFGQTGKWLMDARFNRLTLTKLIEDISEFRDRVTLTRMDAITFITGRLTKLAPKSLIYFDPPYVNMGGRLYRNSYVNDDHELIAGGVQQLRGNWIVSYDNVPLVRQLYSGRRSVDYGIGYSANRKTIGREVMFFSDNLIIPTVPTPVSVGPRAWKSLAA
jgi:DNA adenine methylase